jgi:hypothetical protein
VEQGRGAFAVAGANQGFERRTGPDLPAMVSGFPKDKYLTHQRGCLISPGFLCSLALSRVINGKAAISTDLALKLEEWLDGPSAEVWLGMQLDHDLWKARNKPRLIA